MKQMLNISINDNFFLVNLNWFEFDNYFNDYIVDFEILEAIDKKGNFLDADEYKDDIKQYLINNYEEQFREVG